MGSLIEELQRREAAARQEVDDLREEIARTGHSMSAASTTASTRPATRTDTISSPDRPGHFTVPGTGTLPRGRLPGRRRARSPGSLAESRRERRPGHYAGLVHGAGSRTTPPMTVVTILATAAASGGAAVRSANSRCPAPIKTALRVSMSASAAMRPRSRSAAR
jgi:hypothetical protein